jgi:hypothetical protein
MIRFAISVLFISLLHTLINLTSCGNFIHKCSMYIQKIIIVVNLFTSMYLLKTTITSKKSMFCVAVPTVWSFFLYLTSFCYCFRDRSHYIVQAGLEFATHLC